MFKTLVLYENENCFDETAARVLAPILGPSKCGGIEELSSCANDYDVIVLCTYLENLSCGSGTKAFLIDNSVLLSSKKAAVLCICSEKSQSDKYLKSLGSTSLIFKKAISADEMSDMMVTVKAALDIKQAVEQSENVPDTQELRKYADDFLRAHETCCLASGFRDTVRATPIEYIYFDGALYILTEGGKKFANITLNPNVSVGVFDSYTDMNSLGGMQITGMAEIVAIGSGEYISVLQKKNLPYEKIAALPIDMNMLRINIVRIEFLWSRFRELGLDSKQIIDFA